jgi:hypothetical protein
MLLDSARPGWFEPTRLRPKMFHFFTSNRVRVGGGTLISRIGAICHTVVRNRFNLKAASVYKPLL